MKTFWRLVVALLFIIPAVSLTVSGQVADTVTLNTGRGTLEGTLLLPAGRRKMPVALIIAGSGPTDRNGNNPFMQNNALKMLADSLAAHGIASLRYDKRGVGRSKEAAIAEADLRFDDYVDDARQWLALLAADKRFRSIVVVGHSQGSLIGLLAARQGSADKFISIAGVGRPAADLIREQLAAQPPEVLATAEPILAKLEQGETTEDVPPGLFALFRPSVQPFMISWFAYDPQQEIARLTIPVLIVQGTTDIQVTTEDARALATAGTNTALAIIPGMNHVMKPAPQDRQENIATYSLPELPLHKGLLKPIIEFIQQK